MYARSFLFALCVALTVGVLLFFFFSSRRRHTRCLSDWSSDVCSSDLADEAGERVEAVAGIEERDRRLERGRMRALLEDRGALAVVLADHNDGPADDAGRSEERRVGKSENVGGSRIVEKNTKKNTSREQ